MLHNNHVMNQDTLLYTLPQWFIFAAFATYLYGKVEQKKIFRIIGSATIILLGIFALYNILSGSFSAYNFLSPEEVISEELFENEEQDIPLEAKLFPAYIIFVISGLLAIPATVLEAKNSKIKNFVFIPLAILTLSGFFIIVGTLRAL